MKILKTTGYFLFLPALFYLFQINIGFARSVKTKSPRPNILFVISDDQSWLHTSIAGDPQVKTPYFDRIAKEGILFTNSFCTSPSCTPSRSSILSGQDIWRIKQAGLLHSSIPADLPLFTHILDSAGYHVGCTGKGWNPGHPLFLGKKRDPFIKTYNEVKEGRIANGICDINYSANFSEFLKERKEGQPFFFWCGFREPHRVYEYQVGEKEASLKPKLVEVPKFWPDVPIVRSDILDYYYEIMWFDTHLGSMIETLEEIGELDNTIIIVTSDNGMPFPRAKVNLYDWGTHMPLAIRWGDKIKPKRYVSDFVSHADFAPTILEAAGIIIPEQMNGKSLMNIFESEKSGRIEQDRNKIFTALERHTYCRPGGATYPMRAIRTDKYLYIRNFEPDRWPTGGPDFISSNKTTHGDVDASPTKSFMLAKQEDYPSKFDLCFGKRPAEELYLVKDINQVENIAYHPKYTAVKDSLKMILMTHLKETGDPRVEDKDPWQDYIYHQYDGYGTTFNKVLPKSERQRAKLRPSHKPTWELEKIK
ncbi:sulfatase-like hydrolase/transferase [Maribellus comscasis]|uniref:Sulfatase-like hydrolase/transferase n=1 Tax=Maribellus comscasis TaxID=2681766 RepID=A0A6I6K045_9BACT|nr:sulfatase [Maribellus comscasis]QGY46949.1 sulfatase-like hydrolase/transferase [Maribellus comscasis]